MITVNNLRLSASLVILIYWISAGCVHNKRRSHDVSEVQSTSYKTALTVQCSFDSRGDLFRYASKVEEACGGDFSEAISSSFEYGISLFPAQFVMRHWGVIAGLGSNSKLSEEFIAEMTSRSSKSINDALTNDFAMKDAITRLKAQNCRIAREYAGLAIETGYECATRNYFLEKESFYSGFLSLCRPNQLPLQDKTEIECKSRAEQEYNSLTARMK